MEDIEFYSQYFYITLPLLVGDIELIESTSDYYLIKIKLPERISIE